MQDKCTNALNFWEEIVGYWEQKNLNNGINCTNYNQHVQKKTSWTEIGLIDFSHRHVKQPRHEAIENQKHLKHRYTQRSCRIFWRDWVGYWQQETSYIQTYLQIDIIYIVSSADRYA